MLGSIIGTIIGGNAGYALTTTGLSRDLALPVCSTPLGTSANAKYRLTPMKRPLLLSHDSSLQTLYPQSHPNYGPLQNPDQLSFMTASPTSHALVLHFDHNSLLVSRSLHFLKKSHFSSFFQFFIFFFSFFSFFHFFSFFSFFHFFHFFIFFIFPFFFIFLFFFNFLFFIFSFFFFLNFSIFSFFHFSFWIF